MAVVTRDESNERAAQQLADFLTNNGLLGVRHQGNVITYMLAGADLVIVQVKRVEFSETMVDSTPLRDLANSEAT